jgi:hypothetical protein
MVNIIVNSSMTLFAVGAAVGMAVPAYLFTDGYITISTTCW